MKKCSICGRETNKTYNLYGYSCVCSKHMHQIFIHKHPLDNNPRSNADLNDYTTDGITATFNIYNQKNEKNGEFIIDFDDLEKVKYHKWRISHSHVVTGQPSRGTQRDLARIVLDVSAEDIKQNYIVVDHINGNAFDNRKKNLRICHQADNILNKSFMSNNTSGFIGVSYRKKRNKYDPEIRKDNKRCHLGYTQTLEEAVYKRYYAEQLIFKECANGGEQKKKYEFTKNLPTKTKKELQKIVEEKLLNKKLWQLAM